MRIATLSLARSLAALLLLSCAAAAPATGAAPASRPAVISIDALDPIIPLVDLDRVPLRDAISRLSELSGVNVAPRWHVIENADVSRDTPVTLRVVDLPLQRALVLVGELAARSPVRFATRGEHGVVILTLEEEKPRPVVRAYDVRDLLTAAAASQPARPPAQGKAAKARSAAMPRSTEPADRLMEIVRYTIEPETWRNNGGSEGSIYEFDGKLVIAHVPAVHDKIAKLLETLRGK